MKHVFVSYAWEDMKFAREVTRRLRKLRRVPWQDVRNLRAGDNWQAAIDEALKNAEALVVVMSPDAIKSQYVTYEWAFALGAGVRVIPVLRKRTDLHPRLKNVHYVDFTRRRGAPWVQFREALPARVIKKGSPEVAAQLCLVNDRIRMNRGYYVLKVFLTRVPRGVKRVAWEVHDETLARRNWLSRSSANNFAVEMLANGDVLVTALLKSRTGATTKLESTLRDALRRGHRRTANKTIQHALETFEDNAP